MSSINSYGAVPVPPGDAVPDGGAARPVPLLAGGLAITNGLSVLLSFEPVCRLVMPVVYAVSGTIGTTRLSSDWSLSNQILHT